MAGFASLAIAAAVGGVPAQMPIPSTIPAVSRSATVRLTAPQLLGIADRLIQSGRQEQAAEMLTLLAQDPDPDVRNEARYRQSLQLEAKGRDREAAVLLRRIIDDKPDAVLRNERVVEAYLGS